MIGHGYAINAIDIQEYNRGQSWTDMGMYLIKGNSSWNPISEETSKYFWIRNSKIYYDYSAYDSETTYAIHTRCWYDDKVWKSRVADNLGNTPAEGTYWTEVYETTSSSYSWKNIRMKAELLGGQYGGLAEAEAKIYKVTWDPNDDHEILTLVTTLSLSSNGFETLYSYTAEEPGYYKVVLKITVTAGSWQDPDTGQWYWGYARAKAWIYAKQADGFINEGSLIAKMNSSYSRLEGRGNLIDVHDAKNYQFSSKDFLGGEAP